jgi:hypothetical protein
MFIIPSCHVLGDAGGGGAKSGEDKSMHRYKDEGMIFGLEDSLNDWPVRLSRQPRHGIILPLTD